MVLSDLSHAARLLVRSPRFTALAVFTFALGIGANGVVFSSIKSVLYAKLPFRDPDTLVRLAESIQSDSSMPASFANFGQALRPITAGFAIGVAAAVGMTRMLAAMLFGVQRLDPASLIAAVVVLGLVALAACSVPARRAMHLDPVAALRDE